MAELEEMLLEENPGMPRGDAHYLAWEWLQVVEQPEHTRLSSRAREFRSSCAWRPCPAYPHPRATIP